MNVRDLESADARAVPRENGDLPSRDGGVPSESGAVYETRHRRADGRTFAVEVSTRRMAVQGHTFHQYIVRDITERKRAEQDRAAWKLRYELATAAAGQVTYEYDPAGGAVLWGGSVRQVFGYERDRDERRDRICASG